MVSARRKQVFYPAMRGDLPHLMTTHDHYLPRNNSRLRFDDDQFYSISVHFDKWKVMDTERNGWTRKSAHPYFHNFL